METVEIVIRIPQDVLNTIWVYVQSEIHNKNIVSDIAYKAIANGTVFPKGHGRLISTNDLDITKLVDSDIEWVMGRCDISRVQDMIDNAPTVIEADKEVEV